MKKLMVLCAVMCCVVSFACNESSEGTADGGSGNGGNDATVPIGCQVNSECPVGQKCVYDKCVPECREDIDCLVDKGDGFVCREERCVPGSATCLNGSSKVCGSLTGACRPGTKSCVNGVWGSCLGAVEAVTEICDSIDNNCDGVIDEGCDCRNGETQSCGSNSGECRKGTQTCANGKWGACVNEVTPTTELCDGQDNDCDGVVDDINRNKVGDSCRGVGVCVDGVYECADPTKFRCSTLPGGSKYANGKELCDSLDNDCDGKADNGFDVGLACIGAGACAILGVKECLPDGSTTRCSVGPGGSHYAGAPETCNGLDDDCDSLVDNGCDCINGQKQLCGSDVGECGVGVQTCANGQWGACVGEIAPTAELCDNKDNDCDGTVDNGFHIGEVCSGKGVCGVGVYECVDPNASRCSTEPGASNDQSESERCNGRDDDCDGTVDNGFNVNTSCVGVGVCAVLGAMECKLDGSNTVCSVMPGGSDNRSSPEVCDNFDNDCNGVVDDFCFCDPGDIKPCGSNIGQCKPGEQLCDVSGQWGACVPGVSPSTDGPGFCDGIDNNCDNTVDEGCVCVTNTVRACGSNVGVCKQGTETCDANGQWGACANDVKPALETCNGLDDNCDVVVDEGCSCLNGQARTCGSNVGQCKNGLQTCANGVWGACQNAVDPTAEICDGIDNDCNATIDDGCFCVNGQVRVCGLQVGACKQGSQICASGIWGICQGGVDPSAEICDDIDNDCDGVVDNGCACVTGDIRICGSNVGECKIGTETCGFNGQWGACVGAVTSSPELCNGKDDNCDGATDEGCICVTGTVRACGSNLGICKQGTQTCNISGLWDACFGAVNALPAELCNGLDDDCDNTVSPTEADADSDGYRVCDSDCNDANANIHPGAIELCDGIDNNCNNNVDEGYFVGAPCRGLGECGMGVIECTSLSTTRCSVDIGGSQYAGTADGTPGACDNKDNDCDGTTDEGCECVSGTVRPCGPTQGSVGQCRLGTQTCTNGAWAVCAGEVNPIPELCNGLDDDCDGTVLANEADADNDTYRVCNKDCDDANPAVHPNASELCNNVDDDCDGLVDEPYFIGASCQGTGACGAGWLECATTMSTRCSTNPGGSNYSGMPEICDYIDNDCDNTVDNGVKNACGYCGAPPLDGPTVGCDGIDNDCDGTVDEGCACNDGQTQVCGTSTVGECQQGIQVCDSGVWGACQGNIEPGAESCDGKDNDCNGVVDNGCACVHGTVKQCGSTSVGECQYGLQQCVAGVWNACVGNIDPVLETCDGKDNDCNGTVDNGLQCEATFTWTPPTAIASGFTLYGCYGTHIETIAANCPDVSVPADGIGDCGVNGLLVCLGTWSAFCTQSSANNLTCAVNIPSGYYFEANAERAVDSMWMCHSVPNVVEGTAVIQRGASTVAGTVVDNRSSSCNLRWTMP